MHCTASCSGPGGVGRCFSGPGHVRAHGNHCKHTADIYHGVTWRDAAGVGVTLTWRTRSRVRPSMPPRILRASHHLQARPTQDPIQVPQRLPCAAVRLFDKVACGMSAALPVISVVGSEHQQQRERKGGQHEGLLQAPVQKIRWVAVSHLV